MLGGGPDWTPSFGPARYRPNKPVSSSPTSLSKISPYLLVYRTLHDALLLFVYITPCSPPQPSPHTRPIMRCSLLAPVHRAPHPCLSLLAPAVPHVACLLAPLAPASLGVPPASTGVGVIAHLRFVLASQGHT